MRITSLPAGTVHDVIPADWMTALESDEQLVALWLDITPLARNEWICWIQEAKQATTRERRITVGVSKLQSGMRRPCCWAGCIHRVRNGT